ncbi:ABC transporter ATP-binding protein [Phytohabitans suffuscus]
MRLYRVTRRRPRGRGRHAGTVTALDDVTLSVPAGQAVALAGPSGSGKSTLLRLASAQDRPDAGSVIVDGVRIESLTSRQATRFRRRIGVVSHDSRLMSALTAAENVMFPLLYQRVSFDPYERALRLLDAVGLAERASVEVPDLSGGEQQRVVLARALANRPRLVIADEPVAGLDQRAATEVLDLLKRMTGTYGMTLLLSTTDDAVAARCPRVVRLRDGAVVDDFSADTGEAAREAARRWIERSAPVL